MTSRSIQPLPGTYVLVCYARRAGLVRIGQFGELSFRKGTYLYVGSALGPGGLLARLAHHMRPAPMPHWHIDYLRVAAPLRRVWFCYGPERREHDWARALGELPGGAIPYPGFGSSDCDCKSHLFYFRKCPSVTAIDAALHESTQDSSARHLLRLK